MKTMKKFIYYFMGLLLLISCTTTTEIYSTPIMGYVDNICMTNRGNYEVTIWSYYPKVRTFKFQTDSLYIIGQQVDLRNIRK